MARAFNQVLRPGGTLTARLPVANQLFRIGCSGIKVDSPPHMNASLSTTSPPAQPTMAFFEFYNKMYTCAHNNGNNTNNKIHACIDSLHIFHVDAQLGVLAYDYGL